jgi:23S rRNA (guanosine2251-2'-O)-methyltransferase
LIVLLDGITDPQNLGALVRTGHCFGVNGFVIPGNRSASLTAAVMKASAGALQYTPVAMVVNLARTIDFLKEQGFWIYGADAGGDPNPRVFDGVDRLALVMGSEGKGIRSLVRKKCDFLVSIPMKGKIDSLNVSVAAGIIVHQIVRRWDER